MDFCLSHQVLLARHGRGRSSNVSSESDRRTKGHHSGGNARDAIPPSHIERLRMVLDGARTKFSKRPWTPALKPYMKPS